MTRTGKTLIGVVVLTTAFLLGALTRETGAQQRRTAPYEVVEVDAGPRDGSANIERALNEMAEKGWSYRGAVGSYLIFFKAS